MITISSVPLMKLTLQRTDKDFSQQHGLVQCIFQKHVFEFYMSFLPLVHHKINPGAFNYTFRRHTAQLDQRS